MDNNFYEIEYYDADNNYLGYSSIGQGKQVIVKAPLLDVNNWMILFKAERIDSKSLGENSSDSILNSSIKDKSVVLYPIPAKEKLTIECSEAIKHIHVIDKMGRRVLLNKKISSKKVRSVELDLNSLSLGVYNIQIFFSDGSSTVEKFIKL